MQACLHCAATVVATEYTCSACGLAYRGHFPRPRLARLDPAEQHLAELLLLAAGNLKTLEQQLGISYPTVRKRVGALRTRLEELRDADRKTIDGWLDDVERGTLAAGEAARYIEALNGGE